MSPGDAVGVFGSRDVHNRADDVGQRGPGLIEGILYDFQGRFRLIVGVTGVVGRLGAGAGYVDVIA